MLRIARAYMLFRPEVNHVLSLMGYVDPLTDREWDEFDAPPEGIQLMQMTEEVIGADHNALMESTGQHLLPVEDNSPQEQAKVGDRLGPEGEFRQLSMFRCDIADYMVHAEKLDPEDLRNVVEIYQGAINEVIRRFDGFMQIYQADKILACFGYPTAHEDDAKRAVHAGLEILESIGNLNFQLKQNWDIELGTHIFIITSQELVADQKTVEDNHLQILPGINHKITDELMASTEPNVVFVSDTTFRLVYRYFTCELLDNLSLVLYRVLGETGVLSSLEADVAMGRLTPLVGREQELNLLLDRWEQAKGGQGQIVLLSGEPGIGKSRLVHELKERVETEYPIWLECRCSAYHQNSALYPVKDLLQRVLHFETRDTREQKLEKLERYLMRYPRFLPEIMPLICSLLSLSDQNPPLTEAYQKQKTLDALLNALLEAAAQQPLLLVVEDLHWIDPSTMEFLSQLSSQMPRAHILVVLTFRQYFLPPWDSRSFITHLPIARLTTPQIEEMIGSLAEEKAMPAEIMQQLVIQSAGNPLFLQELIDVVKKTDLLNGGTEDVGRTTRLPVPSVLHGLLFARVEMLPLAAKKLAQLCAAIGSSFSFELVNLILEQEESILREDLGLLVDMELLDRQGLSTYTFRHDLIQETTYQSMTKRLRKSHHERIVLALEEGFPYLVETQPEIVAHHYSEASLFDSAIKYWQLAAQRAQAHSAHMEAIVHLNQGLELIKKLPNTPNHIEQEFMLQTTLGVSLMSIKGYAAPEVEKAYGRARDLSRRVKDTPEFFTVMSGLCVFYLVRSQLKTALELGEQCLELANSVRDDALLIQAHGIIGSTLFRIGEFRRARGHLLDAANLYDASIHGSLAFVYGQDPKVSSLCDLSWDLWMLGYPDQALKSSREALTLAGELSHPFTQAFALFFAMVVHHCRIEIQATKEKAQALFELSGEQDFRLWKALAKIFLGWAMTKQGEKNEGVNLIRQGLSEQRATGAVTGMAQGLALLAQACGEIGRSGEGLIFVEQASKLVIDNGEHQWEAEIIRIKGELLRSHSPANQMKSETCFRESIRIARRQGAKSLELRAMTSLSRLWDEQGTKLFEARDGLSKIYGWFTEGIDTADLRQAKELIEVLR